MEFSPEEGDGEERVENVMTFQYLERPLDKTDDDCPDMHRNIIRARSV